MCGRKKISAAGLSRPSLSPACFSPGAAADMFSYPWEKTVMFLNVPFRRESANAAKLLIQASEAPEFVRQAAKGGILPAERNIKKHHRFF